MISKKFIFFVFCFILLSHTLEDEIPISYSGSTIQRDEESIKDGANYYKIKLNSKGFKYFYVKVVPKVNITSLDMIPNQIVYFYSNQDKKERDARDQFAQSHSNDVDLFIKKEEITDTTFFIGVQCASDQDSCDYNITFTTDEAITQKRNDLYTYYVSEKNTKVEFRIPRYATNTWTGVLLDEKRVVTFWIKAGKKVSSKLTFEGNELVPGDHVKKIEQEKFGIIWTVDEKYLPETQISEDIYFTIEVQGEEGDLISFGSRTADQDESGNAKASLLGNEPEIAGYLNKDFHSKDCFNILPSSLQKDYKIYLSLHILTRIGKLTVNNTRGNKDFNETNISNGYTFLVLDKTSIFNEYCIAFSDRDYAQNITELTYILQAVQPSATMNMMNIYSTQRTGDSYQRITESGTVRFFNGMLFDYNQIIDFSVESFLGAPLFFFVKCNTYPKCNITEDMLFNKTTDHPFEIKTPNPVNNVATWRMNMSEIPEASEITPISKTQYLIVVLCQNTQKGTTIYGAPFCVFQTRMYTDKDTIPLSPELNFYQYVRKDDQFRFEVPIKSYNGLTKVFIELMIISGDIQLEFENYKIMTKKFSSGNKIYSTTYIENNNNKENIYLNVIGQKHSYFTLQFSCEFQGKRNDNKETLESGINYLETIDNTYDGKLISIVNIRQYLLSRFLVSFYAVNCKFQIARINDGKAVDTIDYNSQDLIVPTDKIYFEHNYTYLVTVSSRDSKVKYNGEMCMIYVLGYELDTEIQYTGERRQIVMSDNVPIQVIFTEDVKQVKLLLPDPDFTQDIIVEFNNIDLATYEMTYYISNLDDNVISTETFSDSYQTFIPTYQLRQHCSSKYTICNVLVKVKLLKTYDEPEPQLEIKMRTVEPMPTYISKGQMKSHLLVSNRTLYLYTDIGKELTASKGEQGDFTITFRQSSAAIFARIVRKDLIEPEEGANWQGYFRLPTANDTDLLKYDGLSRKTYIYSDNTTMCDYGCYLLVGMTSTVSDFLQTQYRFKRFNIVLRTTPYGKSAEYPAVVDVPINQYIAGSLLASYGGSNYNYYSIWLPYDGESLEIDFQAYHSTLYINLNDIKPSPEEYHFMIQNTAEHTITSLTKEEIIKVAEQYKIYISSLKDLELLVAVIADFKGSDGYSSSYTFNIRVRQGNITPKVSDIIPIKSEQKVLCRTNSENKCYFAIFYYDIDILSSLTIHAYSQNPNAKITMYGDFVDKTLIETRDSTIQFPYRGSTYSTDGTSRTFLFVPAAKRDTHFLLGVESDVANSIIEVITNMYLGDLTISPNPISPQLFNIRLGGMFFFLPTSKDLFVNVVSLNSEQNGVICWYDAKTIQRKYELKGAGTLSLTSGSPVTGKTDSLLSVELKGEIINQTDPEASKNIPGFVFYIQYDKRPVGQNFDELNFGISKEVVYRTADFPLTYYCKLPSIDNDINIFLNFYEMIKSDGKTNLTDDMFIVRAFIVPEEMVYAKKLSQNISPASLFPGVSGSFDSATKVASVLFTKEYINYSAAAKMANPNIWVEMLLNTGYSDKFTNLLLESGIIPVDQNRNAPEKIYQYMTLSADIEVNTFKFRVDKEYKYIRVVFSCEDYNLISYTLTTEGEDYHKNSSALQSSKAGESTDFGKGTVDYHVKLFNFEHIYLNVFHLKTSNRTNVNYVFKYIIAKEQSDFYDYRASSPVIKLDSTQKGNQVNVHVKFNPINNLKQGDQVDYSIRFLSSKTSQPIYANNIAKTSGNNQIFVVTNPTGQTEKQLEANFMVTGKKGKVNVIAHIASGTENEILAYDELEINYEGSEPSPSEDDDKKTGGSNTGLIIAIVFACLLGIGIVILVVVLLQCKNKNKDLLDKVNKTSFAAGGNEEPVDKTNENLLLNNQDE